MPGLDAPDPSTVPRLHAYTSVWRLRADAWTSLADVTKRLADALTPTDLRPGLQARITELVLLLDPLETYWAYPGRGQLQLSVCAATPQILPVVLLAPSADRTAA